MEKPQEGSVIANDGHEEAAVNHFSKLNIRPSADTYEVAGLTLPPPGTKRWSPHRKAAVLAAVRGGYISLDQARERYQLSLEEFLMWQHGIDLFGLAGLRVSGPHQKRNAKLRSAEWPVVP